jgi:hypothetical protein
LHCGLSQRNTAKEKSVEQPWLLDAVPQQISTVAA